MYSWVLQTVRRTASSDKRFLSKGHFQILTGDIFFWSPFILASLHSPCLTSRVGQKTRSVNNHNTCMLWPFLHIIGTTSQNFKDLGQCLRGSPEIAIFWTSGRYYTFAHVFRMELKHMAPIKACHTTASHRSCLSSVMSLVMYVMSHVMYVMSHVTCHVTYI